MLDFADKLDGADDLLLLVSALAALLIGAFAVGMLFNDLSTRAAERDEAQTTVIAFRPCAAVTAPEEGQDE